MTLYYTDKAGNYIGAFEGAKPPDGSIEVAMPPEDARMTWNGKAWIVPNDLKLTFAREERRTAYNDSGATIDDLVVALWKKVAEGDSAPADAIEVIRLKIKHDIPNPP